MSIQDTDRDAQVVRMALDVFVSGSQLDSLGDDPSANSNPRVREYVLSAMQDKLRETGMIWVDNSALVIRLKPETWINGSHVYEVEGLARESERVRQLRLMAEMSEAAKENVRLRSELEVSQANEKARSARLFADARDEHWNKRLDTEMDKRATLVTAYEDKLSHRERVFNAVRLVATAAVVIDIAEALALLHVL